MGKSRVTGISRAVPVSHFTCFLPIGTDANSFPIREEFAKSCFETLLQFSFVNDSPKQDATGMI